MKVLYDNPNNDKYYKWIDDNGVHDIWYEDLTRIYSNYNEMDIPQELKDFLGKWDDLMQNYKKNFVEMYPVKLAKILFIYNDCAYCIFPTTISATEISIFGKEVEWDSLFEAYQKDIRDDLRNSLGVTYTRYIGFLD